MKRAHNSIDLTGKYFGLLKVLFYYDTVRPYKTARARWFCECMCGRYIVTTGDKLKTKNVKSCGCLLSTHKMSGTRIHRIWKNVMGRCHWTQVSTYNTQRYKERGIVVCTLWHTFENFYEWASKNGYEDTLTIDRIDNNGPYSPENCRWVSRERQSNNMSTNHLITFNNKTQSIADWSREVGLSPDAISSRKRRGWTDEQTLTISKGKRR